MKATRVEFDRQGFQVVLGDERSQAATMVIAPGEKEGGPGNSHRGADQWLYVVSGTGEAVVNDQPVALEAGSLLLIQRGDRHEVRSTGEAPLRTLSFYVPPAYGPDGEERDAARPS